MLAAVVVLSVGLAIAVATAGVLLVRNRELRGAGIAPVAPAVPAVGTDPAYLDTPVAAAVLGVLPGGVVVVEAGEEVSFANEAARQLGLFGRREGLPADLRAQVRQTRRDGVSRDAELSLAPTGPGRQGVWIRAHTHRLRGGQVALLVDDVTEARRVEDVRRDFVANVGHEIKTPVGAIELLVEAAIGAGEDQVAVRRFLSRLRAESSRLARLVQEILDLSRLQGGDPLPKPLPVNVRQIVSEAVDRAETAATAKAIRIVTDVDDLEVLGSEGLLVTAVTNLLDNAVAYSAASTTVAVTAREADGWVNLAVADQGVGMDVAETARIFERFYRIDPARSRATGGTGLGLAIVKHIVSNHGGEVRVWSRPGAGSTFTLRLPRAPGTGVPLQPTTEVVT